MQSAIPFSKVGTLDELLDRAKAGQAATGAMELIKDELSALKEDTYLKLLNCPDSQLVEYRAQLKALELLARKLLAKEAQGELAYREIMSKIPGVEQPVQEPFKPARVARKRSSRTTKAAAP